MITPRANVTPGCFKTVKMRLFEVMYPSGVKTYTLEPGDILESLDWEWKVTIIETGEVATLSKKNYDWSSLSSYDHRIAVDLPTAIAHQMTLTKEKP